MVIEIVNYEKYNPRKDQKNYTWFRFENNFFDPDNDNFFNLNPQERLAWLYLLCKASKQNKGKIEILPDQFEKMTGLKYDILNSLINQLLPRSVLLLHESVQSLHTDVQLQPATRRDETRRDETISYNFDEPNKDKTPLFPVKLPAAPKVAVIFKPDLEALYKIYPRKGNGKSKGMLRLKSNIKNQADYDKMKIAIENYKKTVQGTEKQYIQLFSTFVNKNWFDFIEPVDTESIDGYSRISETETKNQETEDYGQIPF